MQTLVRIAAVLGVVFAVVILGVVLGWFGVKGPGPQIPPTPPTVGASDPSPGKRTSNPEAPTQVATPVRPKTNITSTPAVSTPSPAPVTTNAALIPDWEDKLENILSGDGEEREKVRQLLVLFSGLPEEGQVEVVQHLSNLVEDQDYAGLRALLVDAMLPEEVLDVLLADVLNRPNALKLPVLLEIARNTQHPKAQEAKDLLELYLEDDYGQDWNQWQARTEQWLKDNPD